MTISSSESNLVSQSLLRLFADLFITRHKLKHLLWQLTSDSDPELIKHLRSSIRSVSSSANRLGQLITVRDVRTPMDISTLVLVSSVKDTQLDDSVLEALHSICFDHVQISEDADLVLTVVRLLLDAPAVRTIQNIQRNNELFASALSDFLPVPGEIVH